MNRLNQLRQYHSFKGITELEVEEFITLLIKEVNALTIKIKGPIECKGDNCNTITANHSKECMDQYDKSRTGK